jgi:hypothetical protein
VSCPAILSTLDIGRVSVERTMQLQQSVNDGVGLLALLWSSATSLQVWNTLKIFLDMRMLCVASGGEFAFDTWQSEPGAAHWFHASVTKNTAARFAMERELALGTFQQTFLVTLDCDNVMPAAYPRRVAEQMAKGYRQGFVLWREKTCAGGHGGTCGRIGTWMHDGHRVGMYDEEPDILGSGAQDIDFMERVRLLGRERDLTHLVPQIDVGIAVPNSLHADFAENWSVAKIKNCNPEDVARLKTWAAFNAQNSRTFAKKKKERDATRNNRKFGASFRWHSGRHSMSFVALVRP